MTDETVRELKSIVENIEQIVMSIENPLSFDVQCPECEHDFTDEIHDGYDLSDLDNVKAELTVILERETGKDIKLL